MIYVFCAASIPKEPKNYASVLVDNLRQENKARSCIAREIRYEQVQQDNKKLNLVVKGSCPSEAINDRDHLKEIVSEIGSSVIDQDFETKRIGKIHKSNGRQLLLIKFKDAMKRKEFLRNSSS